MRRVGDQQRFQLSLVCRLLTSPEPSCAHRYFGESSREIGVKETDDFIYGPLHIATTPSIELTEECQPACRVGVGEPHSTECKAYAGVAG
jgi:hypothetical protein